MSQKVSQVIVFDLDCRLRYVEKNLFTNIVKKLHFLFKKKTQFLLELTPAHVELQNVYCFVENFIDFHPLNLPETSKDVIFFLT